MSAQGLQDLFAVVQAAKRVPVLARDWIIHPLQLAEAKEAGAAGVLGVIGQVNGRGTAVMSSFGSAIGLDAPVEVVNAREVEGLSRVGVTFYGINLSVGLSVAVPGFATDMAHGLLGELPFGAISIVGVKDLEQARKARLSGADALLIKKEMIEAAAAEGKDLRTLLDQVLYVTCGDD
jgi:indole-3-glycerol phosphate synthase